jgi:outer membrane protein assembly factor BamA/autotransporter translocation and assembly factor TamB
LSIDVAATLWHFVRRRPWLTALGGAALLLLVAIAALHTAPVRAQILSMLLARLARTGIVAQAENLDYNLLTLDIRLRRVTLATAAAPSDPFLVAEEVHAVPSWSVLLGRIDVKLVEIIRPRVVLRRSATGQANWPTAGGQASTGSTTTPFTLGRVRVEDLGLEWRDEDAGLAVNASGVTLDLSPTPRDISGPLRMTGTGRLRWRDRETRISALEGRLSWNNRDLALDALRIALSEGTLRIGGRIESLLDNARLDLQVSADSTLDAIAPSARMDGRLGGTLQAQAHITGPTPTWQAEWTATGNDIRADSLRGIRVEAAGQVAGDTADITSLTARVAGGSLSGRGKTLLTGNEGDVRLEWQQLDLATLLQPVLGDELVVRPSASASGSLDARWSAPGIETLGLQAETRLTALRVDAKAPSTNQRSTKIAASLPLDGSIALNVQRQEWKLRTEQDVDGSGRVVADLGGRVDFNDPSRSSLAGEAHLSSPDLSRLAATLTRTGLGGLPAGLKGSTRADFSAGGTIGAPMLEGTVDADDVRYASLPSATLHTRASITTATIRLEEIEGRAGQSSARGRASLTMDTGAIDGTFQASLNDLTELSDVFPSPVRPEGSLVLDGTLSGSTRAPRVDATIGTMTGLTAAGQRIDRLEADLLLAGRSIDVRRLQMLLGEGRLDGRGRVDLGASSYVVSASAVNLPIKPVPGDGGRPLFALDARLNGNVDGAGSFANLGGRGRFSLTDTHYLDADLGQIEADVTASGRRVSADIRAPDLAATAVAEVDVDPAGQLSAHGQWEPRDFTDMSRLGWSPPVPLSVTASMAVDVAGTRGSLNDLRVTVAVDRLSAEVNNQAVTLTRPGGFDYDGRTVRVRDIELTTGTSTLRIAGALGEPAPAALRATLQGSLADFSFLRRLTPAMRDEEHEVPPASGTVDLRVDATGRLSRPTLAAALRVGEGRFPLNTQAAVTDAALAARYDAGVLLIDDLRAAFQGSTLTGTGSVPVRPMLEQFAPDWQEWAPPTEGPGQVRLELSSVTSMVAAPFLDASTLEQLEGRVDASIELQADRPSIDRLQGTVTMSRAEIALSGVPFDQQRPTRLVVRNGRVDIADWEWGQGDNLVRLSGGVALADTQAIDVTARTVLDLRLLNAFTGAARTSGRADAEIRFGGAIGTPSVDGYVTFSTGELRMSDPRVIVTDLAGTVTLARDTLTFEQLWAAVNGGETEIAGTIHHRWFKPIDGQISLRTREAAFELSGLRAEANADLAVEIEPRGPALTGAVTFVRSAYREPLSLTGGLLQALRSSSSFTEPDARSALDRFRLDVRVTTEDDLFVDNNYAQLTARADLRLIGTMARPSLTGRVTLAEGGLVFFGGTRYRLANQGSIDFINPARIEPDLDLQAVTRVAGKEITLALKGTPTNFQTSLSSDDPDLSQSDLVSLLVTGRTATDVASGGLAPGSEEVLGLLSGELFGTAGRAVGLDVVRLERGAADLRFDAGLVATETDPGARLTFGKNIGPKTQVVFSQSLRQSGGLTWIVSYSPGSRVELRAVSLDNGDRIYDFRHQLVFGATAPTSARTPAPAPPVVTAVRIMGAGPDEQLLRSRLKLDAGDRFSFFTWQDDRERLEDFYHEHDRLEARVNARRMAIAAVGDEPAGVELIYEVRPGPLTTMIVEGISMPRSVLDAMKLAWTGSVVDEFLKDEVATVARGELVDRGFVQASIVAVIERPSADEKRLRLMVSPGSRAGRRTIAFRGNRQITADRLRAAIAQRGLERSVWLEPDRVRAALTTFYRQQGYLNASVRIGDISLAGDQAVRPVDVDEGEPFHIQEVRVLGVHAFPADEVMQTSTLSSGTMFSQEAIETARRALDEHYRMRGFNSVAVTLRTEALEGRPDVNVTIEVEEGPQQRLREIVTAGRVRTSSTLVARALKLDVGEPVNLAEWYRARRRLFETGAFRSVDIEPEPIAATPGASPTGTAVPPEQPIRAKVTLEEWPAARLRYGLEVDDQRTASSSTTEPASESGRSFGAGVAGDLGFRNLFGHAASAGLSARYTRDFRAGRAYTTSPSFFGLPITSNVFVTRSREEVGNADGSTTHFVTDKTGLTLEQRIHPAEMVEIAYSYAFERNHTFDLNADPNDPLTFDIRVNVARLSSTALVDTRNDLVDAARGWFHASNFEYSPPSLGSDLRFVKYLLQQRYYREVGGIVLAGAARIGLATAFDQTLIPSERFFAGGGNSVRGYVEDVLSPIDIFGDPGGGNALMVFNGEVRFPIFKRVRGVGFLDAGRAFATVGDMSFRSLSLGTGLGLRIYTPVVLLRVDFGVPLDSSVGPRRTRLFFSIGQAF